MKGITLIGMPASGKSTIGRLLAKKLDWPMYDIDLVMEEKKSAPIAQILRENGQEFIKKFEAQCVLELELEDAILSPGGSIIYGKECHEHMARHTHIVYLEAPIGLIEERLLSDPENKRGIVGLENGLEKLFLERKPMYEELAQITIQVADKDAESIAREILRRTASEA